MKHIKPATFKNRLAGIFVVVAILSLPLVSSAATLEELSAKLGEVTSSLNKIISSLSELTKSQQASFFTGLVNQLPPPDPIITSFTATIPNPYDQSFTLSWEASGATDAKLDFSCPINSVQFYIPSENRTVDCSVGKLTSFYNKTSSSIFVQPKGAIESVNTAFILTLFKNGVQIGNGKLYSVVISPTSAIPPSTPTITSFSATSPDSTNSFWITWGASGITDAKLDFSCPINSVKFYLPDENRSVDCSNGKLVSYFNQMSGKIYVQAQGNIGSVTPAFILTLFKNGAQVGISKVINVSISPIIPTAISPSIAVIGTPTLSLAYDYAGKEASLVASYTIKITAGAQAISFLPSVVNGSGGMPVDISLRNTAGQGGPVQASATGPSTILAGSSATYNLKLSSNPNQLFSGTYTAEIENIIFTLNEKITAQIIGTKKTNSVTIIGERAPYISNITSDTSGNVIVTGARLNISGNIYVIDGVAVSPGSSLTSTSWQFKASTYNMANGGHHVQITNPQTGNSNILYVEVNTTGQSPSAIKVLSPNGGEVWQSAGQITDTITGYESFKQSITWLTTPGGQSSDIVAYLEQLVNNQHVTVGRIPPFAYGSIAWVVGIVGKEGCDLVYPSNLPNNCFNRTNMKVVPPGMYYVRLVDRVTGVSDRSDKPFSITTSFPSTAITVISPNGGESFSSSQQLIVSFKPIPNQKTYLNLVDSNNAGYDLLSFNGIASLIGISADKQTVALNLPTSWVSAHGNNYKVEACSVNICDRSDNYFKLTSPTVPTDQVAQDLKAQIAALLAQVDYMSLQLKQCRGVNYTGSDLSVEESLNITRARLNSVALSTPVQELLTSINQLQLIISNLTSVLKNCQNPTLPPTSLPNLPPVIQPPVFQLPVLAPIISRNLYRGLKGEDVTKLQELLAKDPEIYPSGLVTGYYGFLTEAAIQNFQCKYKIVCSGDPESTGYGIVGPKTMIKVNEVATSAGGVSTASGSTTPPTTISNADAVATLQAQVNALLETIKNLTAQLETISQ